MSGRSFPEVSKKILDTSCLQQNILKEFRFIAVFYQLFSERGFLEISNVTIRQPKLQNQGDRKNA